jgi:glycosyltransferase involved in cell wall biosynthesis
MALDNNSFIKVTVIVPVYNVENYLRQCLDSIKNQTLKEIEIILIDDCSTDKSGRICDEYASIDFRFNVIHNKTNIRQGLSRNKGIEIAKGEYVGFVDADDYIDFDYYEKLYDSAISNHSDIAKTESILIYKNGKQIVQPDLNLRIKDGVKLGKPLFLLFGCEHWTAIYKREILIKNNIRYPDIRNAQDDVFLLRYTYYAKSITLISNTYYYYRQLYTSTISVREKPYYESILLCFELQLEFLNQHPLEKADYKEAVNRVFWSVWHRFSEIEKDTAWDDFKKKYVLKTINIMLEYKFDPGFILDLIYFGFSNEPYTHKNILSKHEWVHKIIFFIPKQILRLIKSF